MGTRVKLGLVVIVTALLAWQAMVLSLHAALAAGPLYVAPGGNDSNDCLSPSSACATINGALNKSGDTIRVAIGSYTGTGSEVVLLSRHASLSGGWNDTFTSQTGLSTIDAQETRRAMYVSNGVSVTVEGFILQNGFEFDVGGSGICNYGRLTLNHCSVNGNYTRAGGAVFNYGVMTLNCSTVSGNTAEYTGGIDNGGTLTLNNSTVSGNTSDTDSGILHEWGTLILNSSTVSGNIATSSGGGVVQQRGTVTVRNSIVAGNTAPEAPDCSGVITSAGYSLIGNTDGCTFVSGAGDRLDVDAKLGPLTGLPGYHPLLFGSPAIDAGNPAGCTDSLGRPLDTDQRGVPRVRRCDMGAYEYDGPYFPTFLPLIVRS